MEMDTVGKVKAEFYRLVGTLPDDGALVENSEAQDDVAYLYLTRGSRAAQRWMLKMGYGGWRKRSAALTWSGTDAADGGRYATLPTDFLRACGSQRQSALREANGDGWGQEIIVYDEQLEGDGYYFRGDTLWLARTAAPPTTLYLDYHYTHPAWSASVTIDFPMDARALIVAEAADAAKAENWLPGDQAMEVKIGRALAQAREEARDVARPSRQPRQFKKAPRWGNRW